MQSRLSRTKRVCADRAAVILEGLEDRRLLAFSALINFQPPGAPTPAGYKADMGAVFGDRGDGFSYGWDAANNNAIDRNSKKSPDQRYDTFAQMQKGGSFTWELAVPNGTYDVRPVSGDPISTDAFYHLLAEGKSVISGKPSNAQLWIGGNMPISVTDGRLTISNGASAVNNKINFIEVRKAAPTRPSNLSATAVSPTQINLTWSDNANNEDGFILERNVTSNIFEQVAVLGPNVTSFSDAGLTPDTKYTYQIRAFNDVGQSQNSTVAIATTPPVPGAAPAAPSDLTLVSAGSSFATITWKDNSDNEEKFVIQRVGYNGTFEDWQTVAANTTSATVFLRSAQINQIRVVARNAAGGNSDPSNVLSIATKPEAPIYPGSQAVSSTAIDISWDSLDSCQFHVEKLINGQWVRIASDVLSLSYRDTGLTPGTSYSYRVIAVGFNEAGDSEPSDVVTATTAPSAVTGLAVTGVSSSSVSLKWNDVSGEGFYMIERSLDGQNWTFVTYLFADTTTYTNTGLASGTTYQFRVTGMAYGPVPGDRADPVSARTK